MNLKDVDAVVDRLHRQFGDAVSDEELESVVRDLTLAFDSARIQAFVPVLVERIATDRLRNRAQAG